MPQDLHKILNSKNRVTKSTRPSPTKRTSSTAGKPSSPSPQKAAASKTKSTKAKEFDLFSDPLSDIGLSKLLTEELSLRDVVQTMRFIRSRMFSQVPQTGLHSQKVADLLNYRVSIPPIVTQGHIGAILTSPSKTEREIAQLLDKGVIRKIRVERRRGIGEVLIESTDYEKMVQESRLSTAGKDRYIQFLKQNKKTQIVPVNGLPEDTTGELIKHGFLTSRMHQASADTLRVRPEDRTTLTSIERVSRHASGSVSAVGGQGVIHLSGGTGGGTPGARHPSSDLFDYRIAVPGHGRFMKLAEGSVDWVRDLLGKTKWGEGTEDWLRERFDGGALYGTRWKEFWGVQWDWVLGEVVGLGVAELFETGTVGRGLRALGT